MEHTEAHGEYFPFFFCPHQCDDVTECLSTFQNVRWAECLPPSPPYPGSTPEAETVCLNVSKYNAC